MPKPLVAIVNYSRPYDSVRQAVELAQGLTHLPKGLRVFVKPNIVFWTRSVPFPKWGVITTTRVVEDMVKLLKDKGVHDIVIGEGAVTLDPQDTATQADAFQKLGYRSLEKRYGVRCLNIFERPFRKVDLGDNVTLKFNIDALDCDLIVDLPPMKTHNQTVVSLGIKNLKGLIDINSRKKCHSADPEKDLHFMVARLADRLPPVFTLIDGIYTLERGPGFDGKMHRSNLLVASNDVLAADLVGARLLGFDPLQVPHLVHAASNHARTADLKTLETVGLAVEDVALNHGYDFQWGTNAGDELPLPLVKMGIQGVSYPKYDLSMCTYCSFLNGLILAAIRLAWQGDPWDDVEILTGKQMQPTPGKKKTILLGKCMYQAHKDNPAIQEMIPVKGCPAKIKDIVTALHRAGINADPALFDHYDQLPGFFMGRYQGQKEFDETFFAVPETSASPKSLPLRWVACIDIRATFYYTNKK